MRRVSRLRCWIAILVGVLNDWLKLDTQKSIVFMEALLNQLAICRNPRKVVEALGFSEHLGCNGEVHTWSREYRRVVYHADNFSLYKKERIQIAYEDTPYDAAAELREPHEEGDEAEPPTVVAEVFVPSSLYDQMKHGAGMSFIHNQFMDRFKSGVRYFYSCRVDTRTLHFLVNLLAPARQTSSSCRGEIEELWGTVVSHRVKLGDENTHTCFYCG